MLTKLRVVAKALVAGAVTAIAAATPLASNGLTLQEVLITVGAFLGGAVPTWVVPNSAPTASSN